MTIDRYDLIWTTIAFAADHVDRSLILTSMRYDV